MCPLWSLSVEDLLQWRRLYSATSAVRIPASFPRCAASSSEYATWKPSLCGFRKRMTRSRLRPATRTCWFRIASLRSSDERWQDAAKRQTTDQGRLWRRPSSLYICPLYVISHTGIKGTAQEPTPQTALMPGVPSGTFGHFGMPCSGPARDPSCGSLYRAPRDDKVPGSQSASPAGDPVGWPSVLAQLVSPA